MSMLCRSHCEQKTVVDIRAQAHVAGVVKFVVVVNTKFRFKSVNRKILFYFHQVKFPEIHSGIIDLIDVITSNHWCHPSLAQNIKGVSF